jgi:hypothetical protein
MRRLIEDKVLAAYEEQLKSKEAGTEHQDS